MAKKKVEFADGFLESLKDLPVEDKDKFLKGLVKFFENANPLDSKPVRMLRSGPRVCPDCNSPLVARGRVVSIEDRPIQFFECLNCDEFFEGDPVS